MPMVCRSRPTSCAVIAASVLTSTAWAQPRLAFSQKSFCEHGAGTQKPALSLAFNVVETKDGKERVMPIHVLDPNVKISAFQDGEEVPAIRQWDVQAERDTIVLIDSSGSMLEQVALQTKFEAAMNACGAFAGTFVDGIDRMAVVPFGSRGVASSILGLTFHETRASLLAAVAKLPAPDKRANTGLFTAVDTALSVLHERKLKFHGRQFLLVVLTDGRNDIGVLDDRDLLRDRKGVLERARAAGINVVTLGFGDGANLDEDALKALAWPNESAYHRSPDANDLLAVFQRVRAFQLERFTATVLFKEGTTHELKGPRTFVVKLEPPGQPPIQGTYRWEPANALLAPPFECTLEVAVSSAAGSSRSSRWVAYVSVVVGGFAFYWYLWTRVPARFWKRYDDADRLAERAVAAVKNGSFGPGGGAKDDARGAELARQQAGGVRRQGSGGERAASGDANDRLRGGRTVGRRDPTGEEV
jgi:Mg-chelatase subunit ChlD